MEYLPSKSTMNGRLLGQQDIKVLRTSTALLEGEIGVVALVVVVGTEVGARQSKSLQGQPAEQFS